MPRDAITIKVTPTNSAGFICHIFEAKTYCGRCTILESGSVIWVDFKGETNRGVVYAAACAVAVDVKFKTIAVAVNCECEGAVNTAQLMNDAGFNLKGDDNNRVVSSLPTDSVKLAAFILKYLPEYTIENEKMKE